jgi:ssDNA-specific exonuclease RecJ|uniref:Uncharacterized protein n=1 Tax=Enterococcus phage Sw5 TaxID=2950724 RepID=A0A9E7MHP7_9CAUD|nr:hypothetical protein Sw5_113 [Enterococcus phage Sw5]
MSNKTLEQRVIDANKEINDKLNESSIIRKQIEELEEQEAILLSDVEDLLDYLENIGADL